MSFTISLKRQSKWEFDTCSSAGASIGEGLAGGISFGSVTLKDPAEKKTELHYGGVGVGLAVGFKLGKINITAPAVSIPIAPSSFTSHGLVFVTSHCPGQELTRNDFTGPCAFVEIGLGAVVGYSEVGLLAGIQGSTSFWEKAIGTVLPAAEFLFTVMSVRALIVMKGWNAGAQLGGGGIAYLGFMR